MSNQAVGNVYQTIIEEVVNSSRVDFEENGVEDSVLEDLRLVSVHLRFPVVFPPSRAQHIMTNGVPSPVRRSRGEASLCLPIDDVRK